MKLAPPLALALAAVLVTATGCPPEESPTTDAGVKPAPDAGLPQPDGGTTRPDGGATPPDAGTVEIEDVEFVASTTIAFGGVDDEGARVTALYASSDEFFLSLETYEAYGGPVGPGTVALGDDDTSYDTCGTCLILETDCEAGPMGPVCETAFMPRAEGSIAFTELSTATGALIAGEARGLVFREVTIDPETYEATTVQGGRVLRFAPWSFSAEVVDPE